MNENRSKTAQRLSAEEIEALPALITTEEYAAIVGSSPLYVARMCADRRLPAVRRGRAWLINKAKALEALGLA